MQAPSRPNRRSDVETYVLPDGTSLLFDPVSEIGHPLDVFSSLIWDYADGTLSVDEIVREVCELVPQIEGMQAHTLDVLREFSELGLLADGLALPLSAAGTI